VNCRRETDFKAPFQPSFVFDTASATAALLSSEIYDVSCV